MTDVHPKNDQRNSGGTLTDSHIRVLRVVRVIKVARVVKIISSPSFF